MIAKCSVTFEYESRPPDTWRGTVEGGATWTVMKRAVQAAQEKLSPRNWTSANAVILERDGVTSERVDGL